jgi:hypothetical protein
MNSILVCAAAIFAVITGLAHSILGERRLIGPLLGTAAPGILKSEPARRILRFAWHITTLSWVTQAAVLVILVTAPAQAQGRLATIVIGASFLLMALASIVISRGRHVGWPMLAATGIAALTAVVTGL